MRPGNRIKARAGLGRRVRVFQGEVASREKGRALYAVDLELSEVVAAVSYQFPTTPRRRC